LVSLSPRASHWSEGIAQRTILLTSATHASNSLGHTHRRLPGLADALAHDDLAHSQPQNFEVEPEGEVVNIPDIIRKFLFSRNGVAPIDLRPTGNAEAHFMASRLFRRIEWQVLHQQRARPHQAHVALDDFP